jgi:hypothetical protein
MATSVAVFNANSNAITASVNRGASFTINAANSTTWVAGTVTTGGPGWDNGGASLNNLAPGDNVVQASLGSALTTTVRFKLPNQAVTAVQVYCFFPQNSGVGDVTWIFLYSGQVVVTATSTIGGA